MDKHHFDDRRYSCRYDGTRTITALDLLAERILADLPGVLEPDAVPATVEYGIHIVANTLLRLNVGGLPDTFTFSDRVAYRYSPQAIKLIADLNVVLESYNWTNPSQPTDRRFFCSVHLVDEAEYHSIFWTPGVVRIF